MIRLFPYLRTFLFIILFISTLRFQAQNDSISSISYIQKLIKNDSLDKARNELKSHLDFYRARKETDSLIKYVFLVGSFKLANNNHNLAIKKAEAYGEELKKYNSPFVDKEALLEISWIYDDAGYTEKAYELIEDALAISKQIKDPKKASENVIYHNLGYLASVLGKYDLSKKHYTKAIKLLETSGGNDYESLHQTYNALGGVMWYSTKLDSSLYYFEKSIKVLEKTEPNPMNSHYRKALVQMNIAVLNHSLGKIDGAIESSKHVISGFQKFLEISKDESRKLRALKHQLAAIDNLASFYHSIGEFERADQLITYSYTKKLKNLAPEDNDLTISLVLSAQAKSGLRDFEAANKLIDEAITRINTSANTQLFWQASAFSTKANISHELGDHESAKNYFNQSYNLHQKSLGPNEYTRDFLDEMIDMSQFFASTGDTKKAISIAKEAYDFVRTSDYKSTIQEFHHTVNLSEVYFKLKHYKDAILYSDDAIRFLDHENMASNTFQDSIQIQYRKPKAILVNAKSKYFSNSNHSEAFLNDLSEQVKTSIEILEQRKSIMKSYDDLSVLISENIEIFNFSKQLLLDLYHLTENESYLNQVLTIHESSLYNRIRTRLNLKNNLAFANIPEAIIIREKFLKDELKNSVQNNDGSFKTFFETNTTWTIFLDSLKQQLPKYYKMRYETIEEPLSNIQDDIPENTTAIRYMFVDEQLYAFVISASGKAIFKLDTNNIKAYITQLSEGQSDIKTTSSKLHELYQKLWKPFENKISTKLVIIFPDAELFNLSFESLTSEKVSHFKELATKSLLAKHTISYNYSLLLLDKNRKTVQYQNDFIAFAPEFNDKMKEDYRVAITDSVSIDKTYLKLLPQPFSVDLAKDYSRLFNGDFFINEKASKQIFKSKASEHKIIHIGTHAESNNITPELSRLIFAKNSTDEDNSLYTYEIYNQNLNSNLAILTACETGKPTYQAGEGMISLAHAFNYAGSESILTSLWEIDEKSSAKIIELFYNNLKDGMPKDEALRKAKLHYISIAEGRTITPEYWAGLILIGDASSITFNTSSNLIWYILGAISLLVVIVYLIKILRTKKELL